MPTSKNRRKSNSGESRKANRLKNGDHRYLGPKTGPAPQSAQAPTFMEMLLAADFHRTITGGTGTPEEEPYKKTTLPGVKR